LFINGFLAKKRAPQYNPRLTGPHALIAALRREPAPP
jgi:hypothetical protein